jgi:hypothetical protein
MQRLASTFETFFSLSMTVGRNKLDCLSNGGVLGFSDTRAMACGGFSDRLSPTFGTKFTAMLGMN